MPSNSDFRDLNPPRLKDLAVQAVNARTGFKSVAQGLFENYRQVVAMHADAVKASDMTKKQALDSVNRHRARFAADVSDGAATYTPTPTQFIALIKRAVEAKALAPKPARTDALLADLVTELRISNRRSTYEAEAEALDTGRDPSTKQPTAAGMLRFLEASRGDDAKAEWAKLELAQIARKTADPATLDAIDDALHSPGKVSDRRVESYLDLLRERSEDDRAAFATQALESQDASKIIASFVAAKELAIAGKQEEWSRDFLGSMHTRFPDNVVAALARDEAETSQRERSEAAVVAAFTIAQANELARLEGVENPTSAQLAASRNVVRQGRDMTV